MAVSSLRDLLAGSALNRPGIRRSINASLVVQAANRMIPGYMPGMQAHEVEAISLKDGVLRLRARTSAASHALRGIERHIFSKLKQDFPLTKLDRIQIFVSKEPSRYEFA